MIAPATSKALRLRGRPPGKLTPRRAQVLTYWRKHGPCSLGQLVRACGFQDRSAARRVLKDLYALGLTDIKYTPAGQ